MLHVHYFNGKRDNQQRIDEKKKQQKISALWVSAMVLEAGCQLEIAARV
jgi:hypothetical protein